MPDSKKQGDRAHPGGSSANAGGIPAAAPKVTFLALCFNHAPYVLECLRSIEAQNWPHAEVIVLDNASNDGSADVIRAWAAETRLDCRLMLETKRRGICANLNRMLRHANGRYVALLAADDYWLPHKTARQVAALEQLGEAFGVAYADAIRIDASGTTLEPASFIQAHREFQTLPKGDILHELLRGPYIPAMSTLIRKSALDQRGPSDESLLYEDYDTWIQLSADWQFHADSEPLAAYRVLQTSMINTVAAQSQPEKIFSDLKIMAKALAIARVEAKTRANIRRRIVRLATELASQAGDWSRALQELGESTGLPALSLLAAAHQQNGPLSATQSAQLLAIAVHAELLPASAASSLPPTIKEKLKKLATLPRPVLPAAAAAIPKTSNFKSWIPVLASVDEAARQLERQSPARQPWWKIW